MWVRMRSRCYNHYNLVTEHARDPRVLNPCARALFSVLNTGQKHRINIMSSFPDFLKRSYASVGAFEADYVYLYSDFRYFVKHLEEVGGRDRFCQEIVRPFLERGQTVLTPTFTYTISGCFDVLTTPTYLGASNKWFLQQPQVRRSEHPLFSFAALGPRVDLLWNVGKSAFGHDSVYCRLKGKNAVFLHIGRPVSVGNTACHHIEQSCGATYRIHKAFHTKVYRGQEYVGSDYTAFLRRWDVDGQSFSSYFAKAAQALQEAKMIKTAGEDAPYSEISCYSYDKALLFLSDLFYKDQRLLIESDFLQY